MSLFGLGDITFNKDKTKEFGPLSALEGSKFQTNTFKYPIDVGQTDKAHYMVFYIREQEKTTYKGETAREGDIPIRSGTTGNINNYIPSHLYGGDLLGKVNSGLNQINQATNSRLSEFKSTIDNGISGVLGKISSGLGNIFGQVKSFKGNSQTTSSIIDKSINRISNKSLINQTRNTRLTTDAIALYMPDTLMFSQSQDYSGLTPGQEFGGQAIGQLAQSLRDNGKFELEQVKGLGTLAAQRLASAIGSATVQSTTFAALGAIVNPMLELIYSSPAFRTFQFDFFLYPRSESEAQEVQKIIERFRFHQVPELDVSNGKQT